MTTKTSRVAPFALDHHHCHCYQPIGSIRCTCHSLARRTTRDTCHRSRHHSKRRMELCTLELCCGVLAPGLLVRSSSCGQTRHPIHLVCILGQATLTSSISNPARSLHRRRNHRCSWGRVVSLRSPRFHDLPVLSWPPATCACRRHEETLVAGSRLSTFPAETKQKVPPRWPPRTHHRGNQVHIDTHLFREQSKQMLL